MTWDADQALFYAEQWGEHVSHDMTVEHLGLGPADVVVDVGCGSGHAALLAAATGARVMGVDPMAVMLELAQDATPAGVRVTWMVGTAEALPVPSGEATVVWAIHTIRHWEDVVLGLDEAARVLAPGGRLVVVEEDVGGFMGHGGGPLADHRAVASMMGLHGFDSVDVVRMASPAPLFVLVAHRAGAPSRCCAPPGGP